MASLSRRDFLGSAAAGSIAAVAPAARVRVPSVRRLQSPVAVSSANGMRAVAIAVEQMVAGCRPVDAAVLGVKVVEDDPNDTSVGFGGLPNEEGIVELDACVMDGPSGLGGAVAALRNIKNPAQVALKVMRRTDHVLLVAEGALRFARAHGFVEENLLTERAREAWLEWREKRSPIDDWISPEENDEHGVDWFDKFKDKTGTIHVGAVDAKGDVGSCTTTSGLAFKIAGRVGDSPLLGCGNYCDNDVGTGGSTGRGEACILANGAAYAVHEMASGRNPKDACLAVVDRVARLTRIGRLLDAKGRPNFQVKFYAANTKGEVGAAAMYPGYYATCGEHGPERQELAARYDSRD